MKKLSIALFAAVAIMGTAQFANAQGFYGGGHYDNVPHTTTHPDYQRHRFHVDVLPHTTTHIDQVPHNNFGSGIGSSYGTGYANQFNWNQRSSWGGNSNWNPSNFGNGNFVPRTTTHTDYVPDGNHVDAQRHTTTHFDQVQHGYYRGH